MMASHVAASSDTADAVPRLESAVAWLEGTEQAVAFASGAAAVMATVLSAVFEDRPHIVVVRTFGGQLDDALLSSVGAHVTTVATVSEVAAVLCADTGLIFVETPSHPMLALVDLAHLYSVAPGTPILVDNTQSTPILQQPARHGATLVLHRATHNLAGRCEAPGAVIATNETWAARLRHLRTTTGGVLPDCAAAQVLAGFITLPLRIRAQQTTAQRVASVLAAHPYVDRVIYPALPGGDPGRLIGHQMFGPGLVFAFTVASPGMTQRTLSRLRVFAISDAPGGPVSGVRRVEGCPDAERMLQVSVGLESAADLLLDLDEALLRASREAAAAVG